MNTRLFFAATAFAVLFLSSCGSSAQRLIVDKWEMIGAREGGADIPGSTGVAVHMTAEFGSDGSAKLTLFDQTLKGTYKLNAGNEMEWTLNGQAMKAKVKVTETELEVTDEKNRTIKYSRM